MVSILEPSQKKQRPIPSGPIAKNYLAREGKKLRTVEQREHHLNQLIFPILGDRPTGESGGANYFPCGIEDNQGIVQADLVLGTFQG